MYKIHPTLTRELEIFILMVHNELNIPNTGRWKMNEQQCVHIFKVVLKTLQH